MCARVCVSLCVTVSVRMLDCTRVFVCVCEFVCMCVSVSTRVCLYVSESLCLSLCTLVCLCVNACVCESVCLYLCAHACVSVCAHVSVCACSVPYSSPHKVSSSVIKEKYVSSLSWCLSFCPLSQWRSCCQERRCLVEGLTVGTPPCWSRGEARGAPIECAVGCREVFIVSGC